jgi:hypothetical protein
MIKNIAKVFRDLSLYGLEKLGLYYSKYRAFVYDRDDPKGYGRLRVQVPEVFGDMVLDYWAWPASNYSGIGYGAQVIPQNNDMVWVEFEKGNPRKPLWNYGYHSKGEKPDDLKDPNKYWFRTPKGLHIEFDDNLLKTKITTPNGYIFEMDEDSETIKVSGGVISLNGDGEGGLVLSQEVSDKFNDLESEINELKTIFTSWVVAPTDGGLALKTLVTNWASGQLTPSQKGEFENDNVKHG